MSVRPRTHPLALSRFRAGDATAIVEWVRDDQELRDLAPSTQPPLSAEAVLGWVRPGGIALVYRNQSNRLPIAYGELNPMRVAADHLWLGHVVVDPASRGQGVGVRFVEALVAHAFGVLLAERLSLVVFPTNEPAIRCYQRVGFKMQGEEFHSFPPVPAKHRLIRFELARRD